MSTKETAQAIYQKHIALASTNPREFRKTVMDEIMSETGCSLPAAATHYNTAKKAAPVPGLGRQVANSAIRKPTSKAKPKDVIPDDECFSVIEIVKTESGGDAVGRYQSFILQGDASEKFDEKVEAWPNCEWVMIKGLGPNSGDTYKLSAGEKEIKHYIPETVPA